MLKPFALRFRRLLSAGLDPCLRFLQALYSEPPKRLGGVPIDANGPLVALVNDAVATGATRS